MRRSLLSLSVLLLLMTTLLAVPPVPAGAIPVCPDADKSNCDGRTFPEPSDSMTALTLDDVQTGLESLAEEFSDWLTVEIIGAGSTDGQLYDAPILMAELTAPDGGIPMDDRKVVFVSQSIHGNEPGGREGAPRFIEDLLRDVDPARKALLDRVRLVQVFLNPDGWLQGDPLPVGYGGLWGRQNGNTGLPIPIGAGDFGQGVDLNRNAPWYGFQHTTRPPFGSEVEMQALVSEVQRRLDTGQDLQASADIHGEVAEAAAWLMLSSGEFDLQQMTQQRMHGEAVDAAVTERVTMDQLDAFGADVVEPAILTASSEFGGLTADGGGGSGTGFLGDWFAQAEGGDTSSISTIELLNAGQGPGVNAVSFNPELFDIYADTVRAILGSLMDQAVMDYLPSVALDGPVGYVRDPAVVMDPVLAEPRTQFAFFDDLEPYLDGPLVPLAPAQVTAASLAALDHLIIATDVLDEAALAQVRAFTEAGGNLILTDSALVDLPSQLTGIAATDVTRVLDSFNQVDFEPFRDDPLAAGFRSIAFMLTEPATLGYNTEQADEVPEYVVDRAVWEAAGGTTAGTMDGDATGVGHAPVGQGRVTVIGHLLPPPITTNTIPNGLNDYGVLDTGYQLLFNALGATMTVAPVDVFDQGGVSADVGVTVARPAVTAPGQPVSLRTTVSNAGPDTSGMVTTTIRVPAIVEIDQIPNACSLSGRTLTCTIPSLGVGATSDLVVTGTVTDEGAQNVNARAIATTIDANPLNDRASALLTSSASADPDGPPVAVGLTVDATLSDEQPAFGEVVSLDMLVTNRSAASARDVTVEVDLPFDVLESGSVDGCTVDEQTVTCPVSGSLSGGQDETVRLDVLGLRDGPLELGVTARSTTNELRPGVDGVAMSPQGPDVTERLAGPERRSTAVALSQDSWTDDGATTVTLARQDLFPDALGGGVLAAAARGPLLLTPSDVAAPEVTAEIDRVLTPGSTVHVLGGEEAVGATVVAAVEAAGYEVVRLGGATRFETATTIADRVGEVTATNPADLPVFLAAGGEFEEPLVAAAAAAEAGGVLLLSDADTLPAETVAYLDGAQPATTFAIGSLADAALPSAETVGDDDPITTATAVARRFFTDPSAVGIATTAAFADGLAGGAHIALRDGPILFSDPSSLPAATRAYLAEEAVAIRIAYIFGGTVAISDAVEAEIGGVIR